MKLGDWIGIAILTHIPTALGMVLLLCACTSDPLINQICWEAAPATALVKECWW